MPLTFPPYHFSRVFVLEVRVRRGRLSKGLMSHLLRLPSVFAGNVEKERILIVTTKWVKPYD